MSIPGHVDGRQGKMSRLPLDGAESHAKALTPKDMLMLLYVAVTRAQLVLDNAALAWVEEYL
jgi:hypothetical protein